MKELKEKIHKLIEYYVEITDKIYQKDKKLVREDLIQLQEYFKEIFNHEGLVDLFSNDEDYKYRCAILKYYSELDMFNVFGVDVILALYNNTISSNAPSNDNSVDTSETESLTELGKELKRLKDTEQANQAYYSSCGQKFKKILMNYTQFVKRFGYSSIYDAYIKTYSLNAPALEKQIDAFLISTKDEYNRLLNYFIDKYLPEEIPKKEIYAQEELRYHYAQREILANKIFENMKGFIDQFISIFKDNGFINQLSLEKSKVNIYDKTHAVPYDGMCLPFIKDTHLEHIKVWIPQSHNINTFTLGIHEVGHMIHFLTIDKYENENPELKREFLDKYEWESSTFEFIGKVFERLPTLKNFWNKFFYSNQSLQLEEIEEIEKFCRFIDLTHKIFCMVRFRVIKKLISSESGRFRASELRQFKTEFNEDCKKYLRMDRTSEDIYPNNYFYRLDEAREILVQEEFVNLINWDLDTLLSGKNKRHFLTFLNKGSSQLFYDLLPII